MLPPNTSASGSGSKEHKSSTAVTVMVLKRLAFRTVTALGVISAAISAALAVYATASIRERTTRQRRNKTSTMSAVYLMAAMAMIASTGMPNVAAITTNCETKTTPSSSCCSGSISLNPSLVAIANAAFDHCFGLSGAIVIPSGVTSIGSTAFYYTVISSVDFNGAQIVYVGANAFNGFFSVQSGNDRNLAISGNLVIPASVTYIDDGAFRDTSITSLSFSGSALLHIGADAFSQAIIYGNWGTPTLTGSLVIPAGVTFIGDRAFEDTFLTGVTFASQTTLKSIGMFAFSQSNIANIARNPVTLGGNIVIPSSVTYLGDGAFYSCPITSVTFTEPSLLQSIEYGVFSQVGVVYSLGTSTLVGNLVIPNSVTKIGTAAFSNNGFDSITLPTSLVEIGIQAFTQSDVIQNGGAPALNGQTLVIPGSVTCIQDFAFENNAIAFLTFREPSSLQIIGRNAFLQQGLLVRPPLLPTLGGKLIIPASVISIGDGAFQETFITCIGFSSTSSLTSIGAYAFCQNNAASYGRSTTIAQPLVIPEGVTYIGESAFQDTSITCTHFPSTLLTIDSFAFSQMQLSSNGLAATLGGVITIPDSVTSLGYSSFENTAITAVVIGTGLQHISTNVFGGCTQLATIVIKSAVLASIDGGPFGNVCNGANPPTVIFYDQTMYDNYAAVHFTGCSVSVGTTTVAPTTCTASCYSTTSAPSQAGDTWQPTASTSRPSKSTYAPTASTVAPSYSPTASTFAPSARPTASTRVPTTRVPTCAPSTRTPTVRPSTIAPSQPTLEPSTLAPTDTFTPSTITPSTLAPSVSLTPTTPVPSTSTPTTYQPSTSTPTTYQPSTVCPTTFVPSTSTPSTLAPTAAPSMIPTTSAPILVSTVEPSTLVPTTSEPSTLAPTTVAPTDSTQPPSPGAMTAVPTSIGPVVTLSGSATFASPTNNNLCASPTFIPAVNSAVTTAVAPNMMNAASTVTACNAVFASPGASVTFQASGSLIFGSGGTSVSAVESTIAAEISNLSTVVAADQTGNFAALGVTGVTSSQVNTWQQQVSTANGTVKKLKVKKLVKAAKSPSVARTPKNKNNKKVVVKGKNNKKA